MPQTRGDETDMRLTKKYDSREIYVYLDVADGPIVPVKHGQVTRPVRIDHIRAVRHNDDDWAFTLIGQQIKKDGTDSTITKRISRYWPRETYDSQIVQHVIATAQVWLEENGYST